MATVYCFNLHKNPEGSCSRETQTGVVGIVGKNRVKKEKRVGRDGSGTGVSGSELGEAEDGGPQDGTHGESSTVLRL